MKNFFGLSAVFLCAACAVLGLASSQACAQDDSARIRELEDRVQRLEATVQTLIDLQQAEARQASGKISGEEVSTMRAESGARGAATPDQSSAPQNTEASNRQSGWGSSPVPQELLPNLGKIGATVSFTTGFNSGAFSLNRGSVFGGAVELPLALVPGGRLNYEIGIALAQTARNLPVTSSVAQVANLTALNTLFPTGGAANLQEALEGTGPAPFAVTSDANWKAQILQLTPFVLKYDLTRLDRYRIRPYALVGLGTYVTVSSQDVAGSGLRADSTLNAADLALLSSLLGNSSPFGGSLIGGQIAPSAQLAQRKLPAGQGGVDLGVHFGGGVDLRITNLASFGVDARFNRVPDGLSYNTFAARWGLHF